ncbi:hypothetical protein ILYODFUR_008208 [Ilyodon furcidens]|uniref:Sphingosine-1-phosphate phosphatase 1 n=1 Tax=Ilyodon furcidens TaxID=33524 RepID=A0ABV0U4B6_9TELE
MEKIREHFRYLQDPYLVARFQHICGIHGTFSESVSGDRSTSDSCRLAEQAHSHNNGALNHYTAGETGDEQLAGMGVQRRNTCVTEPRKVEHEMEDSPNGAPLSGGGESLAARGSTLKPLRRNSLTGEAGQEFVIENRFLFYLFTLGTELGNEMFYITFFPFIMWNVDAFVSRRLIMVWVWVMYVGQCTKDVIGWSRPASPPVVKVEMFYNSEYSMPSTHAMSGTAIPFSLFFMTHGRWEDCPGCNSSHLPIISPSSDKLPYPC